MSASFMDVDGFPGYRVGDDGSVWTCRRRHGRGFGRGTIGTISGVWRQLSPVTGKKGYLVVSLCRNELGVMKVRQHRINRLVLQAFVGPCPVGFEGCHGDGIKTNNKLGNLRWGTPKDNADDRRLHGTAAVGNKHPMRKITDVVASDIWVRLQSGESQRKISESLGLSRGAIVSIAKGFSWNSVTGLPRPTKIASRQQKKKRVKNLRTGETFASLAEASRVLSSRGLSVDACEIGRAARCGYTTRGISWRFIDPVVATPESDEMKALESEAEQVF